MATLYIVIIGPGYNSANENHLPEAEDINRAIRRLGSSGINLRISIIDSAINSSPSAMQIIKDYPAEVGTPGGPVRKYNLMITEEGKNREIRRTTLPVMFLDFSGTQTSYELMELLDVLILIGLLRSGCNLRVLHPNRDCCIQPMIYILEND